MDLAAWRRLLYYLVLAAAHRLPGHRFSDDGVFFFSSRRRHTRFDCDGVQTCALPILHDIVEPMTDHVVMTYPTGVQRLERRSGKSVAIGTARSGVVTIIPAGSSARWDIP